MKIILGAEDARNLCRTLIANVESDVQKATESASAIERRIAESDTELAKAKHRPLLDATRRAIEVAKQNGRGVSSLDALLSSVPPKSRVELDNDDVRTLGVMLRGE